MSLPSIQENAIMVAIYLPMFLFICLSFFLRVLRKNYRNKSKLLKSIQMGYHCILGGEISVIFFQFFAILNNLIEFDGEFIFSKAIHLSLLYFCYRSSKKSLPPLYIPLIYGIVWNIILVVLPWLAAFTIIEEYFVEIIYSTIDIYAYQLVLIFLITKSVFSRFEYNLLIKNDHKIDPIKNDDEFKNSPNKVVNDYKDQDFQEEQEIEIDNTYERMLEDETYQNSYKQLEAYKKMLDAGLINQDDYDQKKKKILGLD